MTADSPWRDPVRRTQAAAGIEAARRINRVEIDRQGAVYTPQCCGRPFQSWYLAGQHVIEANCEGKP